KASEAAVVGYLRSAFPAAAVLAEEGGASGDAKAALRFHVDPLDGTTNYAHRVPHFAVNVAAEDASGLAAAATLDPLRGELFLAARGQGATLNGEPIRVSDCAALGPALLSTGFSYDIHTEHREALALFEAFMLKALSVRRFGAAALDLAYLAAGRY